MNILNSKENVVQDRTIYEDSCVFAPNLHKMGLMHTRDYENYKDLFSLMISLVRPPDLMVYLRSSIEHLVSNIQKRGRKYEEGIRLDYLKGLNDLYEEWSASYKDGKLLIIDVDKLDFQNNPKDLSTIIDAIQAELSGLFSSK